MSTTEAPSHGTTDAGGLFTRSATGLVRGVPPRSSLIMNLIPGHPTQTMAAILLFALTVGPGGNAFLALLLVVPMSLAFSYTFGYLTQMIPRSGGDYMLVSRVIHPAIGYVSVFCMTTAGLLSNAFFALAITTAGIAPLCSAVGLIGGYPGLVEFGGTVGSSKGWLLFFGALVIAGALFIFLTARLSIPVPGSPVPITGQTFGVLLVGGALGFRRGFIAVALYVLLGVVGLPFFAEGKGGSRSSGAPPADTSSASWSRVRP